MYFIFKTEVTGTDGNKNVDLFIATRSTMMDHPAIAEGTTLTNSEGTTTTLKKVTVSVYDSSKNWVDLTSDGKGHYTGKSLNISTMLNYKVTVDNGINAEQKTSDAKTIDGNLNPMEKNADGSWASNSYAHLMIP
jgi:hypothetical protein